MRNTARLWATGLCVALLACVGVARTVRSQTSDTNGSAWLGIYLQDLTPELREGLDYKGPGVLVRSVVDGSPADKAGVKKGDVVVKVNSRAVTSGDQVTDMIRDAQVGQIVTLLINRDGSTQTLTAKLAERSGEDGDRNGNGDDDEDDDGDSHHHIEIRGDDWDHMDLPDGANMIRLGRGRLGVRVEDLNSDLASYFDMKDTKGVLVVEVMKDTPAEKAGIKAGDVITKVDTKAIDDVDDLVQTLRDEEGKVSVGVVRHGTLRTLEAELEKARTMRIHTGNGPMSFRYNGPRTWSFSGPDQDDMRKEIDKLRGEIKDLKDELRDMKR